MNSRFPPGLLDSEPVFYINNIQVIVIQLNIYWKMENPAVHGRFPASSMDLEVLLFIKYMKTEL